MRRSISSRFLIAGAVATLGLTLSAVADAQAQSFSIEDVLSYGFPYSLVAAHGTDRIAWIENERGMRNIYTATAPGFDPVRLTSWMEDDGHDLQELQLSDDFLQRKLVRGERTTMQEANR